VSKKTSIITIKTIRASDSGRNERFRNINTGKEYSRRELVNEIENGKVDNAHIRIINGIKTPCSNPDKSKDNNLD
jgi:hypothetical protein